MQTQFVRAVASEKTAEGTKDTKAPLSGELFALHLRAVFQEIYFAVMNYGAETCTLTIGLNASVQGCTANYGTGYDRRNSESSKI